MSNIDTLRRTLRNYHTLAASEFDRLEVADAEFLSELCMVHDNRRLRENPVRLDELFFFPVAHEWGDIMSTIPGLDKLDWTIPIQGYDSMVPYDRINIDRPDAVAKLGTIISKLPAGHIRMRHRKCLQVFRSNPLAMDGQNFFSAAHVLPAGKGTYSNILAPSWVAAGSPTDEEVQAILESARLRLSTISTVDAEITNDAAVKLLVIVHNDTHQAAFVRARDEDHYVKVVGDNSHSVRNKWKGQLKVWKDENPTSGQENYIEFVLAGPNVPKPIVYVPDFDPRLDAKETERVTEAQVAITMESGFGVKPLYPWAALQGQPTTA